MVRNRGTFRPVRWFVGKRCAQLAPIFISTAIAVSCHSQNADKTGLLFRAAADAHRKKLSSISIPLPSVMPRDIASLDSELHSSFAIEAEPIAEVTTIDTSGDRVFSWYKLSLVHAFSHTRLGQADSEAGILANDPSFPKQLLPIGRGELIVKFVGGEIAIDGVKVIYGPEGAMLTPHRPYVFFLAPRLNPDSAWSYTTFVPLGNLTSVFRLGENGDTLTPLVPEPNSIVQDRVRTEYGNHLSAVKARTPEVKQ